MDVPDPRPPRSRARELEPREDRTWRARLVAEVEVVRLGLIEVDRLLDEPQPQHIGVELDVPLSVAGDHGDVVKALEVHGGAPVRFVLRQITLAVFSCSCNYFAATHCLANAAALDES